MTRTAFFEPPLEPAIVLPELITERDINRYEREYAKAKAASEKWSERRRDLPLGASRAKLTTINAKWSIAAEYRDKCLARLEAAKDRYHVTKKEGV